MKVHEPVLLRTVEQGGMGIDDVTDYVKYTDPDAINTNHKYVICRLRHVELRDDEHCYTCGGEFENGRHTEPYGKAEE